MKGQEHPVIVEICGMPGAGKSTVYEQLESRLDSAVFRDPIPPGRGRIVKTWEALRLCPLFVRLGLDGLFYPDLGFPGMVTYRIRMLVRLRVLHRMIRSHPDMTSASLIFDQGPIFCQTFLLTVGSSFCPRDCLKTWIDRNVPEWANMLKGIVWLDALDSTLVDRVCRREKRHSLKRRKDDERREFMVGYRSSYNTLISAYQRAGVPVLRISTEDDTVDVTTDRIASFLSQLDACNMSMAQADEDLGASDLCADIL